MSLSLRMLAVLLFAMIACAGPAAEQEDSSTSAELGAGTLQLLDGYRHEKRQGIDTMVGRIFKPGGTEITYDIGRLAGNYAGNAKDAADAVWYRQIERQGHTYEVVRSNRGYAVVTVDAIANFSAKIEDEADLADLLLMAMTFVPNADTPKGGQEPVPGRAP